MTETTADTVTANEVHAVPFIGALIAAPLVIGGPAIGLIWLGSLLPAPPALLMFFLAFPAVATVLGAPTYLLLGGPTFWFTLKSGGSIPGIAFATNLLSLPLIALVTALTDAEVLTVLGIYAVLGSIFAPIWGAIFQALYRRFTAGVAA